MIVRDSGLRSALIARLSLQGESLVTLEADPEDPIIRRIAPAPRILVIDKAALGDRLKPLVDSNQWGGIIILADQAEEVEAAGRVRVVPRGHALVEVTEALARWRPPPIEPGLKAAAE